MKLDKLVAGLLAFWLSVAPGLAAGAAAQDLLVRYQRGEITPHEYEAARRDQTAQLIRTARASTGPSAPDPENPLDGIQDALRNIGNEPAPGTQGDSPSGVKKIATWIKDIPKRWGRRFTAEDAGFETAAEAADHIENAPVPAYTANAAQREADSDWTRPLKVTARGEVDTIQTVIERVVGVGGMAALAKALSGDAAAKRTVDTAKQVVARMTPSQKNGLIAALQKSPIAKQVGSMIGGKPTTALGKIVKDSFGNNMLLAVAAAGVVGYFINDGLDLDTLKDNLVALNAIEGRRSWRENLVAVPLETVAYYHLANASNNVFEKIWNKVGSGTGGLAAWVKRAEASITRFGQAIVKRPPPELAEKAKALGNTAKSLGLPGVSGATALTFKGLVEAGFSGVTLGMIGIPLVNAGWKLAMGQAEGMYIGGSRGRYFARYDLAHTYYQRTGNKLKDAVEERKIAMANHIEAHQKFPYSHFMNYFLRVTGGFIGAVVASSLLAPTGFAGFGAALVVSAIFSEGGRALGNWLGAKFDTKARRYAKMRKKNAKIAHKLFKTQGVPGPERQALLRTLAAVDKARLRHGVRSGKDLSRVMAAGGDAAGELAIAAETYEAAKAKYQAVVARTAAARATDAEKLLKASQVSKNVRFVGSLDDIVLERDGDYVTVRTPDGWTSHASPRFDFIDAMGRHGIWDPRTNRIHDVGSIAGHNGNRVAFVDQAGLRIQGGVIQAPSDPESANGNIVVTKNGVILERGDAKPGAKKKTEWRVLGYGGEYDVVVRETGQRFVWDGDKFQEKTPAVGAAAAAASSVDESLIRDLLGKKKPRRGQAVSSAMRDLARFAKTRELG